MENKVVFLVKGNETENGEVIAAFINFKRDKWGNIPIYTGSAKEDSADPCYLETCRLATPKEYKGLKEEMQVKGYQFDVIENMPKFDKLKQTILNFKVRLVINGLDDDGIDLPQEFTHKILLALNKGLNPTDYNIEVTVSSVENPDNGGLFYK